MLAFLPVWILVAKLAGLYDADHRAMRHLTVDEAPAIVAWGVVGAAAVEPARRAHAGRTRSDTGELAAIAAGRRRRGLRPAGRGARGSGGRAPPGSGC